MGRYKWDVNNVYNTLDRLELSIKKLQPTVDEIHQKATKLRQAKNLPQYVSQRLDNLIHTNSATVDRLIYGVRSVRSTLPEIERNYRHKLPRIRAGNRYKVMLGGAFLCRPDTAFKYYSHEESKNLFLGDVITYQGCYVLEGRGDGAKPQDIFECDGFTGALQPIKNGRANLHYLAKAR